jgi:hypothetical protein
MHEDDTGRCGEWSTIGEYQMTLMNANEREVDGIKKVGWVKKETELWVGLNIDSRYEFA